MKTLDAIDAHLRILATPDAPVVPDMSTMECSLVCDRLRRTEASLARWRRLLDRTGNGLARAPAARRIARLSGESVRLRARLG
ncbi:hypothetical protein [Chelatococcus albus]|nr:hypothetical protein [Chelatococcus sp. SYSU_G07232]